MDGIGLIENPALEALQIPTSGTQLWHNLTFLTTNPLREGLVGYFNHTSF